MQLKLNFTQPINKPWWMGLPCKKNWYFDLLAYGCKLEDLSKPWLILQNEIPYNQLSNINN